MSVNLSLFAGVGGQFFDNNGAPLSGGLIYTYAAGTTTPQTTYTTSAGNIANANPIVLDSAGRVPNEIWLTSTLFYKFLLKTSVGTQIASYDNIGPSADSASLAASTGASLIGYTQGGAGAVATNVQNKLRQSVSPVDFGAVGDGTTNDSAALILAASANKPINLCGLNYYINTNAIIALTAPMFNGTITVGTAITGNAFTVGGNNNYIKDVIFVGGATVTATAVTVLSSATNFTIANNTFNTFKNIGIACQAGALYGVIEGNKLYACSAISSGSQYGAITSNASNTVICGNTITQGSQTGISVFGVSQVVIDANIILGDNTTNSGGIITDGYCTGVTISNNLINLVQTEGIQVAGSIAAYSNTTTDIVISGNVLLACALAGVVIYAADAGAVTNVSITGNCIRKSDLTGTAIQINRAINVTITGNTLGGYLVGVDNINSPVAVNVVGNNFTGQGGTAIKAWASKSVVAGNKIIGNLISSAGIVADIAFGTNIIINDNVIDNCLTGAAITFSTTTNSIYFKNNHFISNTTDYTWTNHVLNSTFGNTFALQTISGSTTITGLLTTVACPVILSTDRIQLRFVNPGTGTYLTVGAASIARIDAATQFLIVSTNASDVSNYEWELIR